METDQIDPSPESRSGRIRKIAAEAADVLFLGFVLVFSAIAVAAIALVAPLALGLSVIAGAFSKKDAKGRWRDVQAA